MMTECKYDSWWTSWIVVAGMLLQISSSPTGSLKITAPKCMRSSKLTVLPPLHRPLLNSDWWVASLQRQNFALWIPLSPSSRQTGLPRSRLLLPKDCPYLSKVNGEIEAKVRKRKVGQDDYDLTIKHLNCTKIPSQTKTPPPTGWPVAFISFLGRSKRSLHG